MKHRNKLAATSVAAIVGVAIAGCSGSSGSNSPTGGGASASSGTNNTAPANPSAVFTLGQTAKINELDESVTASLSESVVWPLIYDGLTYRSEDGTAKPDLAESWTTSSDGLTWTFKLRSGVKYASGKAFTASDAVANINHILDPKLTTQWRAGISEVTKAIATTPTTLTLKLKAPDAQLPSGLALISMLNMSDYKNVNKDGDGTGPYKVKAFVPGQSLDLVPNPNWWGGTTKMGEIKLVTYSDETAAETALRNGTLTALWNPAATSVASLMTGGRQVIKSPNPGGLDSMELDTTSAPFNNVKARQALAYAIDRNAMVKAARGGQAIVNPYETPVVPNSPFFTPGLTNYTFNLDKAKQLFAEAGVTSGTKLTYWTVSGAYPEMAVWGQILQEDLGKIGIKLNIKASEVSAWVAKFYPDGKKYPGLIVSNELSFYPPPDIFAPIWFSSKGTCECNWKGDPEYNAAVKALGNASTTTAEKAAFSTMEKQLNQQVPIIVIDNASPVTITQPGLSGAWEDPTGVLNLANASMS